jgi:hypothetical protein
MGCDKVTVTLRVEKLKYLKFCSLTAKLCKYSKARQLARANNSANSASFTQRQHKQVRRQGGFASPRCGKARRRKSGARNTGIYFKGTSSESRRDSMRSRAIDVNARGCSAHVARARAAMRSGVCAVRPEHRRSWCLCVARVRGPSKGDGLLRTSSRRSAGRSASGEESAGKAGNSRSRDWVWH